MAIQIVRTKNGFVEGMPASNQAISVFKGIPYAKPPVGDLRWREPQPCDSWKGVYQAFRFPNICYQTRQSSEGGGSVTQNEFYCNEYPMSEDCLYLNIWTPALKEEEKLPVVVYLHGGGYFMGYSYLNCYDGEGFAKRGIIYVSLNHRIGPFGYMAHPELTAESTHHTSGNYGTLDIFCAIQWIRDNIAAFGGDPDQITLMGQSGGGCKVMTAIASPLMRGRFRRAIMQSGGGIDRTEPHLTLEEAENKGIHFLEKLGVDSIAAARRLGPDQIQKIVAEAGPDSEFYQFDIHPTVDGYVFPYDWNDMFLNGDYEDVDVIIGCTSEEFVTPAEELPSEDAINKFVNETYGEKCTEDFKSALHFHEDPEQALEIYRHWVNLGGGFRAGAIAWCENQLLLNRRPAYQYYFTLIPPGADSAHHSAEHHYVFQTLVRSSRPYTGKDWDLSNTMVDYWSNFIKTGDPNGESLPVWKPYTEDCREALVINYTPEMQKIQDNDYIRFLVSYDLENGKD